MNNLASKSDPALLEVQDDPLGDPILADGDVYLSGAVQPIAELLMLIQSELCPHCVSEREQRFRRAQRRLRGSRPNGNPPDN